MPLGISDNLYLRIKSAVLLLPVVLGCLYYGGWWFIALLVVAGGLMAIEWSSITVSKSWFAAALLGLSVSLLLVLSKMVGLSAVTLMGSGLVLVALAAVMIRVLKQKAAGWWVLGIAYVGLPLTAMWWLHVVDIRLVFWVFLIVWGTDVGGYFAGKGIGGPKLAPRISPKKTWAGLIGGVALAAVASALFWYVTGFLVSLPVVVGLSVALAVWEQVGDLVESAIKRAFNVKDSGGLIPGHGGLLDRVDGLVFVAPVVALVVDVFPAVLPATLMVG